MDKQFSDNNLPNKQGSERIIADKYRLDKMIGMGAHAEVYQATVLKENKLVAVKLFYEHLRADIVQYILKELKVISSLSHPNILQIIAFGRGKCGNQRVNYMVTPLMDGLSLSEMLKKERFTFARSVTIAYQIAQALQYMHEHNFIHRDVKPQNILTGKDGHVVLADFGIACDADRTQHTAVGTIEYCAPEQLDGDPHKKPDPTLDVYSLGMTLYEMLCGINPYRRIANTQGQAAAIRDKYVNEYVPVSSQDPSIPHGLSLVVQKMIDVNPRKRYQTMSQVMDDLKPYMEEEKMDHSIITKTEGHELKPPIDSIFDEAARLKDEQKWDKALEKYNDIIRLEPSYAQAYNYRGDIYLNLQLYARALEEFNLAIQYRPTYYSAYCRRAYTYILLDNFESAQADLDKMIAMFPKRSEAFLYKSLLHKRKAELFANQNKQELFHKEMEEMKKILNQYNALKQK